MQTSEKPSFRQRLYIIIFEADTPAGKLFDVILLVMILLSILVVMLESVEEYYVRFNWLFWYVEWALTILFTLEYVLRLYAITQPRKYAFSFYGIVDLLAILPTYVGLLFPGVHQLVTIRALRLLRIFRIFKMGRYLGEGDVIIKSLKASRPKIVVFLVGVLTAVTIIGSLMYFIETGQNSGFTSIPRSMYWAIVTITTVGYGDIAPATEIGQFLAAILMLTGYAIIAVPTGIISAEIANQRTRQKLSTGRTCNNCGHTTQNQEANYCANCGEKL